MDNPWREFIEKCISGDNYFRVSDYESLLVDLDRGYAAEADNERLNTQALDLACEISKARRERDEARNTLAKIKTIVAGKTWTVALIYQIYTLLSGEKDDLNPSARQVIDEGER